jgi:hypothetical protein
MAFQVNEYEAAFAEFFGDAVHELVRTHDPLLGQIDWEKSPGATASVIQNRAGEDVDLAQPPVSAEATLRRGPIRRGDFVELWLSIDDMAKQMAAGMAKGMFATLDTVTAATGNVFDAGGKSTFDAYLEMLEKIELSLTDDDRLSMPSIVLSPEHLQKLPPPTPEQLARLEELQERKLNELLARRRRRRLS